MQGCQLIQFLTFEKRCVPYLESTQTLPGTMPSSTAALVALRASVTLSFLSPTSASLAPPT